MADPALLPRIAVAAVGIPVVLALLWLGGWPLGLLVAAVAALSAREFYGLAEKKGLGPFTPVGVAAAGALVLLATGFPSAASYAPFFLAVTMIVALSTLAGSIWLRWPAGQPLEAVAVTLMGVLYTGGSLSFVPLLRALPQGLVVGSAGARWVETGFVLLPLLATWAGDSAAYFVGRVWGRTKLALAQSPGKTVEGSLAGLLGSVTAAMVVAWLLLGRLPALMVTPLSAIWIGLLVGVAAQLGDLAESVLKRQAGVKDSGHVLPGHGGMLDRLDSLFFAVPATWAILVMVGVLQ